MAGSPSTRQGVSGIKGVILNVLAVGAGCWLLYYFFLRLMPITPADIRNYIQSFGQWAVVVYIIAYTINTITFFLPIAPLSLASGLIFGTVWGAVYLFIAAVIGTNITFLLARYFGRKYAERLLKGQFSELDEKLEAKGFQTVLFLRLVPVAPYQVINYASGFSKIQFRDYFWATFIGLFPDIIVNSLLGGGIGDMRQWNDIMSPKFIMALMVGAVSVVVPVAYQLLRYQKARVQQPGSVN